MQRLMLLIVANLLLMGCAHSTPLLALPVKPPASAMIKDEPLALLPDDADLGAIMEGYGVAAQKYGVCSSGHNRLIDFLDAK